MRGYGFIGIGSMLSMAAANLAADAVAMSAISYTPIADFTQPKRRRTGKKYPHSSKAQQERNTRQLAAGQIHFISHGPRG